MTESVAFDTRDLHVKWTHPDNLKPYERNARTHSDAQIEQIARSLDQFGWTNPILVDADMGIIAGHGRWRAARKRERDRVPYIILDGLTDEQRRAYIIADNKLALNAGWDDRLLQLELGELQAAKFDLSFTGFDLADLQARSAAKASAGSLALRFGVPPFSVLNAREGWWQDRKAAWLSLGIESEVGRGENLLRMSDTILEPNPAKRGRLPYDPTVVGDRDKIRGTPGDVPGGLAYGEMSMHDGAERTITGTSVFDPVLCELAYRWFCPPGGFVLDPFAGGSVRGIVAEKLGRQYIGIDLRQEQVDANLAQRAKICGTPDYPCWIVGDSQALAKSSTVEGVVPEEFQADFVFSCPPYGDLEVYSDDEADLSTMSWEEFCVAYRNIILGAVDHLKSDRFACFVVGDFRDKRTGLYRDFPALTTDAFRVAGASLYNEAILVTAVGTLSIRAARQFEVSRKLGKTHQNVLVFCKGDPVKATQAIGKIEFGSVDAPGPFGTPL